MQQAAIRENAAIMSLLQAKDPVTMPSTPEEALELLKQGNKNYMAGKPKHFNPIHRGPGVRDQQPFAVVLGCSDSRVPVEVVFDQDVGDLFVIRVAGNIVTPPQTGTVEFAAKMLRTRLVVVMGHTHCGAVTAAVDAQWEGKQPPTSNFASFVEPIQAAIATVPGESREDRILQGVRANAKASAAALLEQSELLRDLVRDGGLRVVAAEYSLEDGSVTFLD